MVNWFLPYGVRSDQNHPKYHELRTIASSILMGSIVICIFPVLLLFFHLGQYLWMFYLSVLANLLTLFSIRLTGHYRTFNVISGLVAYYIIFQWLKHSGFIYSANICIVHMFLLGAILADKKWGWISIFTNIIFLIVVYYFTITNKIDYLLDHVLVSPLYALIMNCLITFFLGSFLAYSLYNIEKSRKELMLLRDEKIDILDKTVRERTRQLDVMRQNIAADFHDQTGNMLAAISRQAGLMKIKFKGDPEVLKMVDSIVANTDSLYSSSKDFLWNLNNDTSDPSTLFQYLTSYGQNFYNQFDVDFSAEIAGEESQSTKMEPFAAINLIFIFKEAMNNVIKHSGASEVIMQMILVKKSIVFKLIDNGVWKELSDFSEHYGLLNIKRRCDRAGFAFTLEKSKDGTSISVAIQCDKYNIV